MRLAKKGQACAEDSDVYCVPEAGRKLGIGRGLAYELVRDGTIPSLRLRGRIVVPRAQLETLLRGRAKESGL